MAFYWVGTGQRGLLGPRNPGIKDDSEPRGYGDRMSAEQFQAEIDVAPNNYNKDCKVLIENGDLVSLPSLPAPLLNRSPAQLSCACRCAPRSS